jgi:hypothetical protein
MINATLVAQNAKEEDCTTVYAKNKLYNRFILCDSDLNLMPST